VADRLVLAKIRDVVGGEKKVLSAGGAPLSKDIEEFFFAAGLLICQGYGLTETTAMLTCNYPGEFRFGTVGTAVRGTEIRIADTGEIQVRGGSVMKGYFGRPEDTAAAFDDGWFRTGDVGTVDRDGFVRVTDRIKDIIITAQGKNVAPQHIEGVLGGDPYIEQVVVIGDRRSYLTALVTPSFELLERYADEHGISYASHDELVARPEVRRLFDERIAEASRELAGYEQVKRYTLMSKEFTQEGGQLTPTLKLKRRVIEKELSEVIDAMYTATTSTAGSNGG
jgi:long-chain acyl-CoA synthetase